MTTTTTASQILHHTTAFLTQVLSQPHLRHHVITSLREKLSQSQTTVLKTINLAVEALETAISSASSSTTTSSLRQAEKLLLSCNETPISCFLLSLIYTLKSQQTNASITLLSIFQVDPSLARTEIVPVLFEELFLIHLLPVIQWFNDQRSRILTSLNMGYINSYDNSMYDDASVIVPCTKLLSKMNGNQALELKELENVYEEVIDDNCRVITKYFNEVLVNNANGSSRQPLPPLVVVKEMGRADKSEAGSEGKRSQAEVAGFDNERYNPIWTEGDRSVELNSLRGSSKSEISPPEYPLRGSRKELCGQDYRRSATASVASNSDSEPESLLDDNLINDSSLEYEAELEENNRKKALFKHRQRQIRKQKQPIFEDTTCLSPDNQMADRDNPPSGKHTPPKDFVCPITSHLFGDPVTLETGQTYERRAIQEWIDRGNSTCPITRQELRGTKLPKTNYVLKRLIATWQEQNPSSFSNSLETPRRETHASFDFMRMPPATSPNSVISQATIDGTISELRQAISTLCTSDILEEAEKAVLQIEQFWQESKMEADIQNMLTKPPVINGFVEILLNSVDPLVLKATVFMLTELGSRDTAVIQTLTRVDSDVECIVALFKKGLLEAVVLIHLLKPSTASLLEMDMVESLLTVIKKEEEDTLKMCLKPRAASVLLLAQILSSSEGSIVTSIANAITSTKVIESVVDSLRAESIEERLAAVGILLRCMEEDGKCRTTIVDKAELSQVLESFTSASDAERFEIVHFLSELVQLNRRSLNEQILHIIKDGGNFSTMHTLLSYLQTAPQDQHPLVAGLLLQLDLLAEPRKMSIYREEAIDTLIACLKNFELPSAQIAAAETIMSLQGMFTASGKSLTRAYLLKQAGFGKSYKNLVRMEQLGSLAEEVEDTQEEERAAEEWERNIAFVLVSHEFGLLFEGLAESLKSKYPELVSASFVSATWLVHMLGVLPDTGIKGTARVCLLKQFVSMFKSTKDIEDKVLSLLAVRSFLSDPEGLRDLTSHLKDIKKGLRELRRSSSLAIEILKVLSEEQESSAEIWNHNELVQVDCSENGEVLSIVCFKDKIVSGHSDGTIKVWTGRGSILHLIQEIREHNKAVTSLAILPSGDRLYSGSLDKTAKVWSIGDEGLNCVEVHDMKDQVHNLKVSNSMCCFIPQGAGVKVHSWNGRFKTLNANKYVKCLTLVKGKLYCGCHDSSIQEIDLATGTLVTIQHGTRKLLGKASPVQALAVHNGLIYSASSGLDTLAVKIWSATNYAMVGTLLTSAEVRSIAVGSELIYCGCKGGTIEIWDRKKQNRIETLVSTTNAKVVCMTLDNNEETLIIGTSDGRIQAWGLS